MVAHLGRLTRLTLDACSLFGGIKTAMVGTAVETTSSIATMSPPPKLTVLKMITDSGQQPLVIGTISA